MTRLKKYQRYYDIIHSDKDYKKEVIFLEKVIKKYSSLPPKSILSLGCGTCGHEILLAKEGYTITGIDYSKEMLNLASKKAKSHNVDIALQQGDIRNFSLDKKFDLAISMYNVFCDLNGLEDLEKTFLHTAKAIKKNGLFVFDCLYGPAILKNKPINNKVKKINFGNKRFMQIRSSRLDIKKSIIHTTFEVFELFGNSRKKIAQKIHTVYFWYFSELQYLLHNNGFEIVKSCRFLDLNSEISENNWDICIVAKKIY